MLTSESGTGAERIVANTAADGSYLLVYTPAGRNCSVDTSVVGGTPRA
ncbi:hypothetical protein HBB16_13985 [Pseudonocardia sp. MCCB 268]|nr:hypothetical protein [Pseudonocardia cytotoxica]